MPTIIVGKMKKATGTGSGNDANSAHTRARMNGTPPGNSTGAKYENLVATESDYSEEGEYRQPLLSPKYRKEAWSYVDTASGGAWTSIASCWYIKITHERTLLPPGGGEAVALVMDAVDAPARAPAKKSPKKKKVAAPRKVASKKTTKKAASKPDRGRSRT